MLSEDQNSVSPDFSPAFEAKPDEVKSNSEDEGAAKRARWYCVLGLRQKTPQTYPLRYVEEAEGA